MRERSKFKQSSFVVSITLQWSEVSHRRVASSDVVPVVMVLLLVARSDHCSQTEV